MDSDAQHSRVVKFGVFEVDLELGELRKRGVRLKLGGQPFEVLRILLERPQQIVTRAELQKRLWPADTFVDYELALKKAINRIREVLGDDAESPRFVETIPRRGYRFIATTNTNGNVVGVQLPVAGTWQARHRLKFALLGIGTAVLMFAVLGFESGKFSSRGADAAAGIHSLAVLPLQNLSGDPAQEYFSDGMTDALITDLAGIDSLRVISRTSSMQYKQAEKPLPEIARELNVDGVIEGTVQRSGDRVRINVQLIHGPSDKHLWANSYERDLRDIFELERDVTQDIARQIQARVTTKNGTAQEEPRPMGPKALEAYLHGNYHLNRQGKGFGDEEKRKAAQYFEQAVDADPKFRPAYEGLALAHENLFLGSSEDAAASLRARKKVAEVDPDNPNAGLAIAAAKWIPNLDWDGAEGDLRRARQLNPRSPYVRSALCLLLIARGHREEGLPDCKIAQRLDPLDDDAALGLYMGRDYDDAIGMFTAILQGDNDGRLHCELLSSYAMKRMEKEMIQEVEQCYALYGFRVTAKNIQRAYETSGYQAALRQWAKETEQLQAAHQVYLPGFLVDAYTILGEKDRALHWLEDAYEHREMDCLTTAVYYMSAEPMYDPLRSDPRFKEILRRVGLSL